MASRFYAQQNFCVNLPANLIKQDKLAGQGLAKRSNVESNKAPTKAPILLKALILFLVSYSTNNLFTQFMKVFLEKN